MDNLIRIENGDAAERIFRDGEYDARLSKLRAHMAGEKMDAVLFTSYHNINYYSAFIFAILAAFTDWPSPPIARPPSAPISMVGNPGGAPTVTIWSTPIGNVIIISALFRN